MASSPSSPAMPPPRHRSPTEKTQLLVLARSPCPQRPSLAPAGPHHLRLCATSDPVPSQRPGSRAPQPPGAWEPHAVGAARGPAQVRAVRAAGAGLHPHRERGPQLAPRPRAHQRRRYVCGRAEPASPPLPAFCSSSPNSADWAHFQCLSQPRREAKQNCFAVTAQVHGQLQPGAGVLWPGFEPMQKFSAVGPWAVQVQARGPG
jgi:hypothetical protein